MNPLPDTGALRPAENGADGDRVVRLTIPAKAEYMVLGRLALTGLSRLRSLSDETLGDLKLAFTEACSNAVRHAYGDEGGTVEILFELDEAGITVEVLDTGSGFDPDEVTGGESELTEGGLGIAIIRSVADEVEVGPRSDGPGARLRFVKLLPS